MVEEKGVTKYWTIDLKDKEGNLHYLVETLSHIDAGSTITVEMMKNGARNYVRVSDAVGGAPALDEQEGGGEEIDVEEIPF